GGFSNDRGLLSQPTNVGRFGREDFTVVPELTTTLGLHVAEGIRVYAGYNLIYWSNVLMPADAIDTRVSVQPVQGRGGPVPQLGHSVPLVKPASTDFWVQGLVVGMEFSY